MQKLRSEVLSNADEIFGAWQPATIRPGFAESAHNLARYLALRRHELPSLQLASSSIWASPPNLRPWP